MIAAFFLSARFRAYRKKVVVLMVLGVIGAVYLTDPGFWSRMETIQVSRSGGLVQEASEASVAGRLRAWRGAWEMFQDHPMGVGVGNFFDMIGQYEPSIPGKDTHNTYFRCLAELGIVGFFVLMLLIANAFLMLLGVGRSAQSLNEDRSHVFKLHAFGLAIALVVYASAGMFISTTYIEEFYWLLMLPVFLKRSLANELAAEESPEAAYKEGLIAEHG
jgi:O-antigen ligase